MANATILVKVTSHKSGGRAKIIFAPHHSIINKFKDKSLTSKHFLDHEINTILIVILSGLPKRRQIVADPVGLLGSIIDWKGIYKEDIEEQRKLLNIAFSLKSGGLKSSSILVGGSEENVYEMTEEDEAEIEKIVTEIEAKNIWLDGFYVRKEEIKVFETAYKLAEVRPVKIRLIGGSGYGKTSTAKAFARSKGMNYLRVNVAEVSDPAEFFGIQSAIKGTITFEEKSFTKVLEAGNAVIVLDEINRVEPWLTNILFPLLDDDAETEVMGRKVVVGPNIIFVMTANLGYQFVGTFEMDAAFVNRTDMTIEVGPLPNHIEESLLVERCGISAFVSTKIVRVINALRDLIISSDIQIDASTRSSIKIAELFNVGIMELNKCFVYVIINNVVAGERKSVIDLINNKLS